MPSLRGAKRRGNPVSPEGAGIFKSGLPRRLRRLAMTRKYNDRVKNREKTMTTHHTDTHSTMRYGAKAKTLKSYLVGLGLCLILTFISFGLVMYEMLPKTELYIALSIDRKSTRLNSSH